MRGLIYILLTFVSLLSYAQSKKIKTLWVYDQKMNLIGELQYDRKGSLIQEKKINTSGIDTLCLNYDVDSLGREIREYCYLIIEGEKTVFPEKISYTYQVSKQKELIQTTYSNKELDTDNLLSYDHITNRIVSDSLGNCIQDSSRHRNLIYEYIYNLEADLIEKKMCKQEEDSCIMKNYFFFKYNRKKQLVKKSCDTFLGNKTVKQVETYRYDKKGNLVYQKQKDKTKETSQSISTFQYNKHGNKIMKKVESIYGDDHLLPIITHYKYEYYK